MANDQEKNRPADIAKDDAAAAAQQAAPKEETADRPPQSRYMVLQRIKPEMIPGYVLRKVGQAYMIMPTGPRMKDYQGMITLNETGAFLYKEMDKLAGDPDAFPKMVQACVAEYGATEEEAKEAVDSFLGQCADCNLLAFEEVIVDTHSGLVIPEADIDQEYVAKEVAEQKAWFEAKEREKKEREQKAEG